MSLFRRTLTILAISAPLATFSAIASAQPVGDLGDPIIARTMKLLHVGPGWTLTVKGSELIYERQKAMWVLRTNRCCAPCTRESAQARATRIKKHGRKLKPRIVFKMAPRWSASRITKVRRNNAALAKRIAALAQKHHVDRLLRKAHRRKNSDPAHWATAAERPRLAAYNAKRRPLQARIIKIPDYHTTHHSLFFLRHLGFSDTFHEVHPPKAKQECYRLDSLIRSILIPIKP
ncbi:MAG: hypothetical protein KAI47_04250 [Deltaproteobacteria bacterium]|nr:hypothetical protein [Deltaproteobacteria bacterium]